MRLLLENGRIYQESGFIDGRSLLVADGRILAIERAADLPADPGDKRLDCAGALLLAGLRRFACAWRRGRGCHGCDARIAASCLCQHLARHGVTSFLATTMSASATQIQAALENIAGIMAEGAGNLLGAHLEGPYLNAAFRGSQPAAQLRSPDPAEYLSWLERDIIRLITLAPELDGADELIDRARVFWHQAVNRA